MKLSGAEIRRKYIQFFTDRGHQYIPSASLIPSNPTVLLTPAGMLPFTPIFLGIEPPPSPPRAVSVQKCARVSGKASDLEYVGRTPRHHTFFEMLGNFSFGDYFKTDAIAYAWEFVTKTLALPLDRLWVTIHHSDDEARQIWEKNLGLPPERVISRGDKDNFWGPPGPTGPCGPCSEIFFDLEGHLSGLPVEKDPDLDADRYVEIWNLVFMQLFQDSEGNRSPLEKKNVDTGMGLERMALVMQGVRNTFETDLLFPILDKLAQMTGHRYKAAEETDIALKIVTDHLRCVTMAVADGIIPSNEGRGYVIRMLLRRAIRYAKKLGVAEPMLFKLVSTIRDLYQETYPELKQNYNYIVETIKAEEKRFLETLERGSKMLAELTESLAQSQIRQLSGEDAFKLYDTYGYPLELTVEIAGELGFTVDTDGFETAMKAQREKARSAQTDKALVQDQLYSDILSRHGATQFMGYDHLDVDDARIVALIQGGKLVETAGGVNQPFELILDHTPFYGESGGQVGDRGILYVQAGQKAQTIVVRDTRKVGDLFVHHCLFDQGGSITVGSTVRAEVNPDARVRTARHHSATHVVHAALRKVLGEHVAQAGSYVGPDGARFDFTFPRALKPEELRQVEMLANQWILQNEARQVDLVDLDTAKARGAIAMFNEKYGDAVRVVQFGPYSMELCGGTHVERLGDIGLVKITSEGAIASGVRRIEFVAGDLALHHSLALQSELELAASLLKTPHRELSARIERLLEEKKAQEKTLKALQEKLALADIHRLLAEKPEAQPFLVAQVNIEDANTLRFMAETLAQRLPQDVVFLGANVEGKAQFVAAVPPSWIERGVKAGDLVKQAATLCEGGGGGKPNFAQAGGKLGNNVPQALAAIREQLSQQSAPVS